MTNPVKVFSIALGIALAAAASFGQTPAPPATRLLLSEVLPGAMSAEHYCTLVHADRTFHSEKAVRHLGKDIARKVYEGQLTEAEWNSLGGVLDNQEFRDLKVPPTLPPFVMQDMHTYTISVAREGKYQNMEFLDSKSLKPYEPQVKPLLQWWKSLRGRRMAESNAPPNDRCALDSTHAIIAQ